MTSETVTVSGVEHRVEMVPDSGYYDIRLNGRTVAYRDEISSGESHFRALVTALRAASKPTADEKETPKMVPVRPRSPMEHDYYANSGVWPMEPEQPNEQTVSEKPVFEVGDRVRTPKGDHCVILWLGPGQYRDQALVKWEDGRVSLHDADHVKPCTSSPSPTAMKAAEEIRAHLTGNNFSPTPSECVQFATIIDRHYADQHAKERSVVEAMGSMAPSQVLVHLVAMQNEEGVGYGMWLDVAIRIFKALDALTEPTQESGK